MKKKSMFLSIFALVIVLTVTLIAGTLAWFITNGNVDSAGTVLTSESRVSMTISNSTDGTNSNYNGQTALGYPSDEFGGIDSPYSFLKTFDITVKNVKAINALSIVINKLKITTNNLLTEDISQEDLSANFTWRLYVYHDNSIVTVYRPDTDNFAREVVADNDYGDFFIPDLNSDTTYRFGLEIIFTGENSYRNWETENYSELELFNYSDYSYMRSVFSFDVLILLDVYGGEL